MPYTPTLWVARSTPRITATLLNKIEQALKNIYATVEALVTGATSGTPGIIQVDSFPGTDAEKMTAALAYAAAQTNVPWLQLPARTFNTGSATFNLFTGAKIIGAGVAVGAKNLEISSGKPVIGKWQTSCGSGANALLQMTSTVYDVIVSGIAFHGGSNSQIFRSTVNAYAVGFNNLTFYGCKHAFGSTSEKFLTTQAVYSGHFTNLSFTDTQYNIGGSDLQFTGYLNMNGPANVSGAGRPMMILDNVGKTDITGYLYLTCENDWAGLLIKGTQDDRVNIIGGTFEGRGASNLATRPVIEVQSGTVVMHGPHIGYVSGSSGTVDGAVKVSGGIVIIDAPIYLRGSGVAATFPAFHQTGGVLRLRDVICGTAGEQVRVRWTNGTVEAIPALTSGLV